LSAATDPTIRVENLDAGYGAAARPAIEGLTFAIPAGRTVAVLGPNGGGKTTLFRALLDQVPERRGSVAVRGPVAYAPQADHARLDFPVDALGVVLMGTYARVPWFRRIGRAERTAARAALARVGLTAESATHFGALSGGQRRRVLIARALAQQAQVLLLDEPLSGVDLPAGDRILELLDELRDDGLTILLSTHDIEQARRFDLVLCLNREGVAFGPPGEALSSDVLQRTYGG